MELTAQVGGLMGGGGGGISLYPEPDIDRCWAEPSPPGPMAGFYALIPPFT